MTESSSWIPKSLRYCGQSMAGVSLPNSFRGILLYRATTLRCSTFVIEASANFVSKAIIRFACSMDDAGLIPSNVSMREMCCTYFSRISFERLSVLV